MRDHGVLDGPVVLFGGAYSNLQALEAMIAEIGARAAFFTGDLVAYCAQPNETAALFRSTGIPAIAGNCERQIRIEAGDCGCGFEDGSACDRLSVDWWGYLQGAIGRERVAWFDDLADIATFRNAGRRYAVIHGGATENNRFLWPSTGERDFACEIGEVEAHVGRVDGIIAGHSGIAFQRSFGDHLWINAGAIGLPPNDGRPETRYAVLSDGEVVFHRLSYDHEMAWHVMQRAGLTQGYDRALVTGRWPSEDVMPAELRRL